MNWRGGQISELTLSAMLVFIGNITYTAVEVGHINLDAILIFRIFFPASSLPLLVLDAGPDSTGNTEC